MESVTSVHFLTGFLSGAAAGLLIGISINLKPIAKTEETTSVTEAPDPKPVLNDDGTLAEFMIKVNGKPFRCSCNCNVFTKPDDTKLLQYECNCCGETYSGEL